jgi:1,4-dihydroxy-2-naphthoyl-CoA synthase
MDFQQIIYAKENQTATITLNRPEKLNAYSETMVHEILAALADARDDDTTRAVIITGAGRGFCSGGCRRKTFPVLLCVRVSYHNDTVFNTRKVALSWNHMDRA